jgi:2-oxoglutarate dehydrogenase E2 component (dihydrolipoamide succinyltransferase)
MASTVVVPELGESVIEATVARWLKHEGDHVTVGEPVVELETEKVNLEVGAQQAGVLARVLHQEGEDVKVGDVLAEIEEVEEAEAAQATARAGQTVARRDEGAQREEAPLRDKVAAPIERRRPSSPDGERVTAVAKRMAEAQQIDLSNIHGTGPGGRITKTDIETYLQARRAEQAAKPQPRPPAAPATPTPSPLPPVVAPSGDRREERVKLSRRRRTIARRLVEAQQTAAMLTTFNEIDMSAVIEIRQRRKETFKDRHGVGLGFMSFFVKAGIGALKAFPQLNAELDGDDLILKHYYDIGMAVGAEEGLVVPVLRDADRLTFAEIERRIKAYVQQAQANTLSLEDLRGGTFTITNGGVFGSLLSTPILNPPQVGILGLHKIEERPIALNGQVAIRPMMYVALSYDHRVVDGREAVQFLVKVKELIEDPETLLLEG